MDNMKNQDKWVSSKMKWGWVMLAIGVLSGITGVLMQTRFAAEPFNFRIITGVGIFLIGIGAAKLMYYRTMMKNDADARRIKAEQHDERNVFIRSRAGNRAFWFAMILVYALLMWESFSSNGSLPVLSSDALWYCLAACVVIPFVVYIISMVVDQQKL